MASPSHQRGDQTAVVVQGRMARIVLFRQAGIGIRHAKTVANTKPGGGVENRFAVIDKQRFLCAYSRFLSDSAP
ncbi:Uncharacterised protein [Salmonella enterica subsp. enterica]|uniref:Uncharacterized protein n=1 Tax=Salmonella enterica I TaxID=59201 RepID=A0A447N2Q5_SALET|nr:Uncharacterised protein [Salmonella enterica subsp. enterica]